MTSNPTYAESTQTIAVVGASTRAAAFSLLQAGHQPITADLFADADLARQCPTTQITNYPDGLLPWLTKTECDAWLYTGALENHPELVDRLARIKPLLGHPADTLRRVRNPLELQAVLSSADLNFPTTKPTDATTVFNHSWLGKTYNASSGTGTGVTEAPFVQRKIEGIPLSAVFVGKKLLGATRQLVGEPWTGAAPYQYCGTIAPWPLPPSCTQQLHKLGETLCHQLDLKHLYGVDLILDNQQQLWTIEINPRYTAATEAIERAHHISAFCPTNNNANPTCVGKAILFATAQLHVTDTLSHQLLQQTGKLPNLEIADIPPPNTTIEVGQPILTIFATTDSSQAVEPQTVEQELKRRAQELLQQLYESKPSCV